MISGAVSLFLIWLLLSGNLGKGLTSLFEGLGDLFWPNEPWKN